MLEQNERGKQALELIKTTRMPEMLTIAPFERQNGNTGRTFSQGNLRDVRQSGRIDSDLRIQ
jgi:hypothetical protein